MKNSLRLLLAGLFLSVTMNVAVYAQSYSPIILATLLTQATGSVPINVSTATTTQLVALSSGKVIYVTGWSAVTALANNVTLVYGTGSNCGTGTTALTGAYNFAANGGITDGGGVGPVLFVPASNALCITTSAATQLSGRLSYIQQ